MSASSARQGSIAGFPKQSCRSLHADAGTLGRSGQGGRGGRKKTSWGVGSNLPGTPEENFHIIIYLYNTMNNLKRAFKGKKLRDENQAETKQVLPILPLERVERRIYLIRGQRVMLDRDLAALYSVE